MRNLSKLNKYFTKYKKKLIAGFFFILGSNLGQIYIPLLMKDSVDALEKNLNPDVILKYALLIILAAFIGGIFRFYIRQTIIVVSREIEYDILQDFWKHIQKLSYRFFKNTPAGQIMALATNDVGAVRMYIGPAVMYSIDTAIRFIFIMIILSSISWKLTLYTLIPFPIASFIVYYLSSRIHKRYTIIQDKFAQMTSRAQENFSGIRVVKSYVREDYEKEEFRKMSKDYMQSNIDLVRIQSIFMPLLYMFIGLTSLIVIWAGGHMAINKEITVGELTAFIAYLVMLTWPMIAFGWVANIIQQADASMGRLQKIFNEEYEIKNDENTDYTITEIQGNIEFRNVDFDYGGRTGNVLNNISLNIEAGQTISIIGHTGSGKSSLVNLIPRLFDVTSGEILIDGRNVKNISIETLRKSIGYVPQEAFLFSDTIENNILYGHRGVTDRIIDKVAELARLNKDVEDFHDKYLTVIGEKGITLSGGQKQRTSLARALASDPKILILDDSFSAVDTKTEDEILKNLKSFMKGRTSIIISHRISTVKDSDCIFVLKDGLVAEQGTHNELVEKNGIYAGLHYKQLLEEELKEI